MLLTGRLLLPRLSLYSASHPAAAAINRNVYSRNLVLVEQDGQIDIFDAKSAFHVSSVLQETAGVHVAISPRHGFPRYRDATTSAEGTSILCTPIAPAKQTNEKSIPRSTFLFGLSSPRGGCADLRYPQNVGCR